MAGFHNLNAHLKEMEEYIPLFQSRDQNVSVVNVGWHLAHSFKVINSVCYALKVSDPSKYKSEFNLKRIFVLTSGFIPRGKARAPEAVIPAEVLSVDDLITDLNSARINLGEFDSFQENNYFYHPYFRQMNKKQAQRLLEVHTKHHLKIIRDILK